MLGNTLLSSCASIFGRNLEATTSLTPGGYKDAPQNYAAAGYTLAWTDRGKSVVMNSGGLTIPAALFPGGVVITLYNNSGSAQTITQGSGLTLKYGIGASPATGNRTLANNGICTVYFIDGVNASISGNGVT